MQRFDDACRTFSSMPGEEPDPDEFLNRVYGVDHAESVRPSEEEPARPPEFCDECGSRDTPRLEQLRRSLLFLLIVFGSGIAVDQTLPAFLFSPAGSII